MAIRTRENGPFLDGNWTTTEAFKRSVARTREARRQRGRRIAQIRRLVERRKEDRNA